MAASASARVSYSTRAYPCWRSMAYCQQRVDGIPLEIVSSTLSPPKSCYALLNTLCIALYAPRSCDTPWCGFEEFGERCRNREEWTQTDLDVTCTSVEVEMEVLDRSKVGKLVLDVFLGRFFV